MGFFSVDSYLSLPSAPETWIVENLLPAGGWLNIYGPPKEGKSFAALQLALDIGSGASNWLGFPIHTSGPVYYLQLDTPRSLWQQRLHDIRATSGLTCEGVHFADNETVPYPFDICNVQHGHPQWLANQIQTLKPLVVVVDTLRELHSGDENDSMQMQKVISTLSSSIRPAACILISHSRKENMGLPAEDRDQVMDDNRGSGYIAGRMDAVVKINRKRLAYKGRTVDKHIVKLRRTEGHLWIVDTSEEERHIQTVLAMAELSSVNQRAEALAGLTGKTLEACRSILRRRPGQTAGQAVSGQGLTMQ
jgi:RecA-family ATPase